MPTLVVLLEDSAAWSPLVIGELFADDGTWLWDGEAGSEDELLVELTRRHGHDALLAEHYPRGFRLDVRYPLHASA